MLTVTLPMRIRSDALLISFCAGFADSVEETAAWGRFPARRRDCPGDLGEGFLKESSFPDGMISVQREHLRVRLRPRRGGGGVFKKESAFRGGMISVQRGPRRLARSPEGAKGLYYNYFEFDLQGSMRSA